MEVCKTNTYETKHKKIPRNPSTAKSSSIKLNTRKNNESLRVLTDEQLKFWVHKGYIVIKNAILKGQTKSTANFLWERIILISSECSYIVPSDMIFYSDTKSAIHAVSRGISNMTKGIYETSNVIVPGSTLNKEAKKIIKEKGKYKNIITREVETNLFKTERQNSLLEHFAATEEIANTISYPCSPHYSATNGSAIKFDGVSSGGIF